MKALFLTLRLLAVSALPVADHAASTPAAHHRPVVLDHRSK